jgi:hypothetical protein
MTLSLQLALLALWAGNEATRTHSLCSMLQGLSCCAIQFSGRRGVHSSQHWLALAMAEPPHKTLLQPTSIQTHWLVLIRCFIVCDLRNTWANAAPLHCCSYGSMLCSALFQLHTTWALSRESDLHAHLQSAYDTSAVRSEAPHCQLDSTCHE